MTRVFRLNRRRASPVVSGIRSRPFWPVTNAGGAYVLGGANGCPQGSGPLFSGGVVVPAGRGRARGRSWPGVAGGDGEEGMGEHGKGGVPVPGAVLADLVVVQAGLVLGLGEAVL